MRNERASYFMAWDKDLGKWGHNMEEARRSFTEKASVVDGVVRWDSNGSVPPLGILQHWADLGLPFDFARSVDARDRDTAALLTRYRETYKGPSEEERMEARAAHGPGQELVNVITGTRWTT